MTFVYPAYLWGLVGLVIPITIHLWSKREGKIIKVGSVKHFPTSESKKSRSIRLNEIVLLLLRSALICLLVFTLAGLQVHNKQVKTPTVLLDPEVLDDSDYKGLIDSLKLVGVEMRSFSHGFPIIEDTAKNSTIGIDLDYWDLMASIDQLGMDTVRVYAKSRISNFHGDRAMSSTVIDWMTVPNKEENDYIIDAFETASAGVKCLKVLATEKQTRTEFKYLDNIDQAMTRQSAEGRLVKSPGQKGWVPIRKLEVLTVGIWSNPEFQFDAEYIEAAINACSEYLDRNVKISRMPAETFDSKDLKKVNIWLSEKPSPNTGQFTLKYQQDDFSDDLVKRSNDKYYLTDRLNRDNVFAEDLATSLFPMLYDVSSVKQKIDSIDIRVLSPNQVKPMAKSGSAVRIEEASSATFLWMFFSVLLIIERIMSHRRKQ